MYKIAICDDCKADMQVLYQMLVRSKKYLKDSIVHMYLKGQDLIQHLEVDYDLIFLDVEMEEMDGIKTAFKIRAQDQNVLLVFYSGKIQPTTDAFIVQPYRYLMKYFSEKRLEKEIEEILEETARRKSPRYIIAVRDGHMLKINIDHIIYISNYHRAVRLWITEEEKSKLSNLLEQKEELIIVSKATLQEIYKQVAPYGFEYAHNSYIVNLKYVIRIEDTYLKLENGIELNISRSKKKNFDKMFSAFLGLKYRRSPLSDDRTEMDL